MNTNNPKSHISRIAYPAIIVFLILTLLGSLVERFHSFTSWLTPPVALLMGLAYALIFGSTHRRANKLGSKELLQYSVVGLGFGMNLGESLASGRDGMMFTIISVFVSVFGTLLLGWFIGRKILQMNRNTSALISAGTAICGGSAIAAVGPILKAEEHEMSVALGTVFLLNAVALFIFPSIGHWLALDQQQFGTWAAIAIHDTSSVVGAGSAYGEEALRVATTIKLTRALWIVPLTLVFSFVYKTKGAKRFPVPLFILFFIGAIILNTYLLEAYFPEVGRFVASLARKGLTLSLFFIGASLTKEVIASVSVRALLQGLFLWILISVGSLAFILLI